MRIVSLLPSATETLFALGLDEEIGGAFALAEGCDPWGDRPLGARACGARRIDLRSRPGCTGVAVAGSDHHPRPVPRVLGDSRGIRSGAGANFCATRSVEYR